MIDNVTPETTLQLARLTLNLHEMREKILNEILPQMAFLQSPDDELAQTLELTTSAIETH